MLFHLIQLQDTLNNSSYLSPATAGARDMETVASDKSSHTLTFESRFESGNLRRAVQVRWQGG